MTDNEKTLQDFKAIALELKALRKKEKEIKAQAKKEGIKLVTEKRAKERSDNEEALFDIIYPILLKNAFLLGQCFEDTISLDKPEGQKWITFRKEGTVFGIGFQDYRKKERISNETDKTTEETPSN